MRLLFLVRQHPAGPDVEACIKNTLLANLLSAPLRPFTILTDLVDDWRFYWVQRSGVWAYKATSRCVHQPVKVWLICWWCGIGACSSARGRSGMGLGPSLAAAWGCWWEPHCSLRCTSLSLERFSIILVCRAPVCRGPV